MKEKTPLSHEVVCFLMLDFRDYVTSEGAVSHNVLYHQPLPITCNQERFYDDKYFELLPIVSTAFK